MSKVPISPEQRDAEAAARDLKSCEHCGKPYLEGYAHKHETGIRPAYDPMPPKPENRALLVAVIRHEYLSEIPPRLHTRQVPSHAEPIGVSQYSAEAAGFVPTDATETALDVGPLGSPPWSTPFHQYLGRWRFEFGEVSQADSELHQSPWTRNLEGVRRWCTAKHRTYYEHEGKPKCWLLARLVTEGGYTPPQAGANENVQLPPETVDRLLFGFDGDDGKHRDGALDKWWLYVSNEINEIYGERIKPAA